jgi:hypothetical protein
MKRYIKSSEDVYSYDRLELHGNYVTPAKLAKALDYEIANDDTMIDLRAVYDKNRDVTTIIYKYIDVSATADFDDFAQKMKR